MVVPSKRGGTSTHEDGNNPGMTFAPIAVADDDDGDKDDSNSGST